MATFKNEEAYKAACNKIRAAVKEAGKNPACEIHIGKCNRKTGASINEGTSPIVTCCKYAWKTCGKSCYALLHIDNIYTVARNNHAENTIMRRRDAVAYYTAFFKAAARRGTMLRINETGDFESAEQVEALRRVAALYPSVPVIGYTRRIELVDAIAALCKVHKNIAIRYSCFTDAPSEYDAHARAVAKTCRVDEKKSTCLSQIYSAKGEEWTCAACAQAKIGCFGKCACVTFKMH